MTGEWRRYILCWWRCLSRQMDKWTGIAISFQHKLGRARLLQALKKSLQQPNSWAPLQSFCLKIVPAFGNIQTWIKYQGTAFLCLLVHWSVKNSSLSMLDKTKKISSQFLHFDSISPKWQGNGNWCKAYVLWGILHTRLLPFIYFF